MSTQIWDQFMAALQEANPNFSRRPSQEALVRAIVDTLTEDEEMSYLVAKAGTGTGKSLASVIPTLGHLRSRGERRPVIISTASKNLQGQYHLKDLPEMAEYFTDLDGQAGFDYAVLKGKSNYLCLAKVFDSEAERVVSTYKLKDIRKLVKDPHKGMTGDLALLPISVTSQEGRALTIGAESCPGASRCPAINEATDCFYEKAKARSQKSDVVVINHALLAIDAKLRARTGGNISLLPQPGVLVVDECHKLVGYVQHALSWHMSRDHLFRFANDIIEDGESLEEFKDEVLGLLRLIPHKRDKEPQHVVPREKLANNQHIQNLIGLISSLSGFWQEQAMFTWSSRDWQNVRRCENLIADLSIAYGPTDNDNFWTELDSMGQPVLYYKPKEVDWFLSKYLWPQASAILMSATPGEFKLGLPEATKSRFNTPSPFDYRRNCRIYIPDSISGEEPREEHDQKRWLARRNETIFRLVEASQGRALLLFTSWKDLNRTHEALAPQMSKYVTVLRQVKDNETERDALAKRFKDDEHSVLFGTESFFEGVDIPGRSLQLVVIAKLPFPSMMDATRGGKLDFFKEMMPEMRLKLEQAAGRLIRTTTDQGLVAVLDSRLLTKGYGKPILSQMPPFRQAPILTDLADAVSYLESLEEGGDEDE